MQTRLEILQYFIKTANTANYSAAMRQLRKQEPGKVAIFMKHFKEAFDTGLIDNIEDVEQVALIQALKMIQGN